MQQTKKDFRKIVAARRKEADAEVLTEDSLRMVQKIEQLDAFLQSRVLLAYMSLPGEVTLEKLIRDSLTMGKIVGVPRVEGRVQHFYEISSLDSEELGRGTMNILEPDPEKCRKLVDVHEAFMIMPGVAFDRFRHRIGYGGGYYDRYLSEHPEIKTCAVAFDFQIFDEIPFEEHDLKPQMLLTPSSFSHSIDGCS